VYDCVENGVLKVRGQGVEDRSHDNCILLWNWWLILQLLKMDLKYKDGKHSASGLTPRTSRLDRFFWASPFYVFSFFIILFCLIPCGRLSWLLVSFWAHVNIVYHIISYHISSTCLHNMANLIRPTNGWDQLAGLGTTANFNGFRVLAALLQSAVASLNGGLWQAELTFIRNCWYQQL